MRTNILRARKALLVLFAMMMPLLASAHDFEVDGIYYNITSETGKQAEVTFKGDLHNSYLDEYSGSITLPATVTFEGVAYSVTSIGKYAFEVCSSLVSVTIPESVTSIGENAFYGCSSLAAIYISSLEAWCKISFASASSNPLDYAKNLYLNGELVTELIIPEGVTSIGNYTFYNCSSLTSITIPEGVTSIGSYAFSNSGVGGSLTIPFSCKYIGEQAFSHTKITRLHFDMKFAGIDLNNLCTIGDCAFSHCDVLEYVNFQLLLFHIGINPFIACESLVEIEGTGVYTNDECTQGNTLIDGCIYSFVDKEGVSYLELISCPAGKDSYVNPNSSRNELISLGDYAFSGCTKITFLEIPNTVKKIGDYSLVLPRNLDYNDNTYRKVIIPESVEEFGKNVFAWHGTNWDVYLYGSTSIKNLSVSMFLHKFGNLHILFGTKNDFLENNPSIEHWFNVIDDIGATITDITLSQLSVKIFEGESISLIATTTPEEAEDSSIIWNSSNPSVASVNNNGKVTAIAPGTATITVTANVGSGVSALCEVIVNKLILGKCATPTISYIDGKISLICEMEEAKVITTIAKGDDETREEMEFEYIPTQTITAYATKENYEDSNVATLTICWIPCSEEHHSEETDVLTIPSKPVLISARDGVLTLSGLAEGTEVALYTTDGIMVAQQQSSAGEAKFTISTNQVYLVHIGDKVVKIGM